MAFLFVYLEGLARGDVMTNTTKLKRLKKELAALRMATRKGWRQMDAIGRSNRTAQDGWYNGPKGKEYQDAWRRLHIVFDTIRSLEPSFEGGHVPCDFYHFVVGYGKEE